MKVLGDLVYEAALDRVVRYLRVVFHIHFFKYTGPVGADGLYTQREIICDLFDCFT